jgi:divalent metal cation (Fe/Co/Zn/Cd) transporter
MSPSRTRSLAFALLAITLAYNVAEGAAAIVAGLHASSLVLVSFGADSYIEVVAAAAVMWRLSCHDEEAGERAERNVLRLIGWTFLVLAAAVVLQATLTLAEGGSASTSWPGVALLGASLVLMPVLAIAKLWTAAQANLAVLAAEAKETIACSYLSLTAIAGLVATAALGWWWLDSISALLMVPWLIKEGREGITGNACFDGALVCWCRRCWYGIRACTDLQRA